MQKSFAKNREQVKLSEYQKNIEVSISIKDVLRIVSSAIYLNFLNVALDRPQDPLIRFSRLVSRLILIFW
jgi:hypothetical protein